MLFYADVKIEGDLSRLQTMDTKEKLVTASKNERKTSLILNSRNSFGSQDSLSAFGVQLHPIQQERQVTCNSL